MGLYIGGALTRHAIIDYDDWKLFDEKENELQVLADNFKLHVSRRSDNDIIFVISNEYISYKHIYEGAVFEYNFTINDDTTFDTRAKNFIDSLKSSNLPDNFKNLTWNSPAKRYYTFS